jgi:hypothetical protein
MWIETCNGTLLNLEKITIIERMGVKGSEAGEQPGVFAFYGDASDERSIAIIDAEYLKTRGDLQTGVSTGEATNKFLHIIRDFLHTRGAGVIAFGEIEEQFAAQMQSSSGKLKQ